MGAKNKTPGIPLNQWEGNEAVRRIDFNEDNKVIADSLDLFEAFCNRKGTKTVIKKSDNTFTLTATNGEQTATQTVTMDKGKFTIKSVLPDETEEMVTVTNSEGVWIIVRG